MPNRVLIIDDDTELCALMKKCVTQEELEGIISVIKEKYANDLFPFELGEAGGGYQFLTKADYHVAVSAFLNRNTVKRLTTAALESLAIIAYKQPVTKSIIEDDGTIKEFIIKQTQIDTFEIEYVSQTELTAAQIQKIESAIALYLESGLQFSFIRKEKLERSHRGKLKQFTSFLKSK